MSEGRDTFLPQPGVRVLSFPLPRDVRTQEQVRDMLGDAMRGLIDVALRSEGWELTSAAEFTSDLSRLSLDDQFEIHVIRPIRLTLRGTRSRLQDRLNLWVHHLEFSMAADGLAPLRLQPIMATSGPAGHEVAVGFPPPPRETPGERFERFIDV